MQNAATTIAAAVGHNQRRPTDHSTSTQISTTPKAMSGSGRRPLLNGSQAARKTAAAVHTAARLRASRVPSRGSTTWLSSSQVPIAAAVAGSRIQTPAVLIDASWASTLWYQSNGASGAPK